MNASSVLLPVVYDSSERTLRSSKADISNELHSQFKLLLVRYTRQGFDHTKGIDLSESVAVERVLLPGRTESGKIPAVIR
jgi:hypothetical protein